METRASNRAIKYLDECRRVCHGRSLRHLLLASPRSTVSDVVCDAPTEEDGLLLNHSYLDNRYDNGSGIVGGGGRGRQ